jgi:PPOX class probable F420-dependent enzyme
MTPEERRAFVREHRTAIFGYARKDDGPAMTALYYMMDGDDILIATMRERAKAKVVARNPKVSLCVLDEKWPPTYLTVFCDAVVEDDPEAAADYMFRLMELMAERPIDESMRDEVKRMSDREGRVLLRLRPYASFETPPRHVRTESDIVGLTHSVSRSVPWNA